MEETQYAQLLALAHQARLKESDARLLEIEAERRQDLRGYFAGLLRQGRAADLTRVAYEIAGTQSRRVAEALGQLPAEAPVWNALLTISSVCNEDDLESIASAIEKWPTPLRVAPASWCDDLLRGLPPAYWRWVRAAKLLREDERQLPQVLGSDAMRSIRLLDASHNDLGDIGVTMIAGSRYLGAVHVLLLTGVGCMDTGATALAESDRMPQLGTLVLSRNDIEAKGAAALIALNRLVAVHSLDLSVNPIDGEELADALRPRAPRPGGLRMLNLEDNGIGTQGLIDLAALPHLSDVDRLALSGNDFGAGGMDALSRARLHIRSLAVGGVGLGPAGVEALTNAAWLPHLRTLDVSDNRIGDEGFGALLASSRLAGLEVLEIGINDISDAGARLLERHTGLAGLRELDLSGNPMTGDGAAAAVSNPALGWLEVLDLTQTCADGSGDVLARALASADHMRSLERLRLPPLTESGVAAIAAAENLSSLRRLEIPGLGDGALARLRASDHLATCTVSG